MFGKVITGLVLTLSVFTMGYGQYKVSGKFVDTKNTPVDYLEVIISVKDSVMKADVTNKEGQFTFRLAKGNYKLMANYFGENVFQKELDVSGSLDLGVLQVDLSTKLKGVTVEVGRKLFSKDRDKLIMHIGNNKLFGGRTAFDILKYAPYLSVDSKSGAVSMKGKPTKILINGKSLRVSNVEIYLSMLPGEKISSIEIISNPSSRYDASGEGGILNIITKKTTKGIEGSINMRVDFSKFTSYNSYLNLNSKLTNKIIVNTFFNYNNSKGLRKEDRIETLSTPNILYDYNKTDTLRSDYSYLSNEVIYDINANNQLGLGFTYLDYNRNSDQNNELRIDKADQRMFSKGDYQMMNTDNYYNLNLNYTLKSDSLGQSVKAIIDYYDANANSNNSYQNLFFETNNSFRTSNFRRSESPVSNKIFSAQVDFNRPFIGNELELGVKYGSISNKNKTEFKNLINNRYLIDHNLTNDFDYKEQILACYLSYAVNSFFNTGISVQLGLRMEYTDGVGRIPSKNYSLARNYLDAFPSIYITKDIADHKTAGLSYARRINRPTYSSFNPTIFYLTDFTSQIGNPDLKPSYTDAFEFSYNTSNVNIMLYCNLINGESREILKRLSDSTIQYQWRNTDHSNIFGVSFSGNKKIVNWLRLFTRASVYSKDYTSDFKDNVDNISTSKNTFQGRISLLFKLPLKIDCDFALEYNGPETYGQFETGENYAFYLNLSKKISKNFYFYLKITDLFDNLRYTFRNTQRIIKTYQYRNNYSTNYLFSIVYSFATGSDVKKQQLNNSNIDLRNRTN